MPTDAPASAPPARFAPTTGLPGLDAVMCGVERGDNIVWQIQSLDEYLALVRPYAAAARAQQRRLIYFRYAPHAALLGPDDGAEIHHPRPDEGFETFVDQVHSVIEAAGTETLYIFDCLSELAETWQSDRMMGNFFRLTCPRLFDLDTVTYFAVMRHTHTRAAMEVITDTTQFLLDVFAGHDGHYIRPVKVRHGSAAVMNLIHAWAHDAHGGDRFRPVTDSATVSAILAHSEWPGLEENQTGGHWQRNFAAARAARSARSRSPGSTALLPDEAVNERTWFTRLSRQLFPDDAQMMARVNRYMTLDDLLAIRQRMIGIGNIGGKALGMLLARAILRQDAPHLLERSEAHDSFYVGSVVYDTFMVHNGLWWTRRRQRDPEGFLQGLDEARTRILNGDFPASTRRQFEGMLDYFGEWPFIVRSSSLLEDRYGNAFAGQYESVFCVNQGPRDKRLADLLDAVREVYASSLSEQALRYRQRHGLLARNEQMALLIMRVSGQAGHRYFHPDAAGVGLSVNPWRWNPKIDTAAGVVRLVAGLGTRAVDRTDDDYTRLIALNAPGLRPESSFGEIARHAQRRMDALDLQENRVISGHFTALVAGREDFPMALFTTREDPERPPFLTFDGLISRTPLVADLRETLACLQAAYAHPVEIEFAFNMHPDGGYRLNLLQCRPMRIRDESGGGQGRLPAAATPAPIQSHGAVIGPGRVIHPERIVYVRPDAYRQLSPANRYALARLIGRINQLSPHHALLLLGPGRWGSRDPWLGIPVAFSEICHVAALGEIVVMHDNLVPDASLGTHFIHELIEADMLYFALHPHSAGNHIDEAALLAHPNRLTALLPDAADWCPVVQLIELPPGSHALHADSETQRVTLIPLSSPPPPQAH